MRGVLSSRSVLRIAGDDARPFLQGLVTQDILHATQGSAVFTALLTPQGKILFDFFLTPDGDGFLVDCAAEAAPALIKRLTLYRLRAKVRIDPEAGLAVAIGEMRDPLVAFDDPRGVGLPRRSIVTVGDMPSADAAYEAARLARGVPEFGKDFGSEEVFLLDVNYDALSAVNYKKGCFVGQEVTSRMKRKGEIRKRTLIARFDGDAPPPGAEIAAGDQPIGEILSGASGVALALVRLDRLKAAEAAGAAPAVDGRTLQMIFPDYLEPV